MSKARNVGVWWVRLGCGAAVAAAVLAGCSAGPEPAPEPTATTAQDTQANTAVQPQPVAATPQPTQPAEPFLERWAKTGRFSWGSPRSVKLLPDGSDVLYLRSGPRDRVQNLYEFDPATGRERLLASAEKLLGGEAEELSAEEQARRERMRISARGIASYSVSEDGSTIVVPLSGEVYLLQRAGGWVKKVPSKVEAPAIDPRLSPDGTKIAAVRGGALYVTDIASGEETRVSPEAAGTVSHGEAEFIAQEEMDRDHGYWWSPQSDALIYQTTDTAGLEVFSIPDPADPGARAAEWPYPRPGKKNAVVTLTLWRDGKSTPIQWDRGAYEYLAKVEWPENGPITLLVQDRRQMEQKLLAVDPATGATSTILTENDDAWLNLHGHTPAWVMKGAGFLWISESGGEPMLELRGRDGKLQRTLTSPGFNLRGLIAVDETRGCVYVEAAPEATQTHIWCVPIDGRPERFRKLTEGEGRWSAEFSEDGSTAVLTGSLRDGTLTRRVVRIGDDGAAMVAELPSVAEEPGFDVNMELTTVRLNRRVHDAVVIRPRAFEAGTKYPVIVSVYAGPGSQMVHASARSYTLQQWMADQGFIVVALDGRGTGARGRAWERAWKADGVGNLIDVALEDQAAGVKALCERYPEMDAARVGITGWSFGGYFTLMAVMRRPDVFSAGVAGAPVVDWADYDTHYTERFLGLPSENVAGYAASNVLTYADQLTRPLLLVHGTADDNVYFVHSLRLVDALFKAGKDFEFLPLPGKTHMVADPESMIRLQQRAMGFFERELKD